MKCRHQTGLVVADILVITLIISLLTFMALKLSFASFGEDGRKIALASMEMIKSDLDSTQEVEFLLASPTPITVKKLSESKRLITLGFSTEEGCVYASMIMSRPDEIFKIESLNAGWLTFDPNTLEGEAKFRHMLALCQHALESEQPVQMTVIKLNS